jgi:hypothetical protein
MGLEGYLPVAVIVRYNIHFHACLWKLFAPLLELRQLTPVKSPRSAAC